MGDNIFDGIAGDPAGAKKAADIIKEAFGDDFGGLLQNEKLKNNLNLRLSDDDKKKMAALLQNPTLLKSIVSNPKAKEAIMRFLYKK